MKVLYDAFGMGCAMTFYSLFVGAGLYLGAAAASRVFRIKTGDNNPEDDK